MNCENLGLIKAISNNILVCGGQFLLYGGLVG